MKSQDTYELAGVEEYKGGIIRVYRPILTPEERERRMKLIREAAVRLVMETEKHGKD